MSERTRREPPCLSDLRLDQLLSGELTGERERLAHSHLAECARCEDRRLELARDRAAFAARESDFDAVLAAGRAVPSGLRRVPRGRPVKTWRSPLVAGALALSAALVALGVGLGRIGFDPANDGRPPRGEQPPVSDPGTRTKGSSPSLAFVVRRGTESFWGDTGQPLAPGDELRFAVSSDRPLYVGVWGVDALGRTSAYHGSSELSRVEAGQRQPLPGAVELDDTLGEERLVAVFCSRAVAGADLARAVAAAPDAPQLPPECSRELMTIVKAPR